MMNNLISNVTDPYAEQRAMSLLEFVNSLFDIARNPQLQGLYIQREDGHNTRVDVVPIDVNQVVIRMDDVDMGTFEEWVQQGYKCAFHQKYRVGIRNSLTQNEYLIKSVCDHPLVKFLSA